MVQALSNFFTYSEQRSKIYPAECINEPMSAINIQVNLNMTIKQNSGKPEQDNKTINIQVNLNKTTKQYTGKS